MKTDSNKTALLVMAHGSRKIDANQEFFQLVTKIANETQDYAMVAGCFLELAEPNLLSAIEQCNQQGIHSIDVYPLFFNKGNHVVRDIPRQIAQAKASNPACQIRLLNYFGQYEVLSQGILGHISQQKNKL